MCILFDFIINCKYTFVEKRWIAMILEFSITNFLSFKDKVTFSMFANSTSGLEDNYIISNKNRILKTAAIYGANASGKTNLFAVLNNVGYMLRNSNNLDINDKLRIDSFKFDKETINKPSQFEISFIVDEVRYEYGFIADENAIHEEYLYYSPNGRIKKIFERANTNQYSFPKNDEGILNDIAQKNSPNKFFIATATTWNYEKTRIPYNFLSYDLNAFNNLIALRDVAIREYFKNDKDLKEFALDFLKKADFNIEDFKVVEIELPDEILYRMTDANQNGVNIRKKQKLFTAFFKHKGSDVEISYDNESKGTQIVFCFIPFIMDAINKGMVLVVDELDRSLHPYLVEMIVQMFNDPNINKNNAQLIFNTHFTNLLNLNSLRRDQIWFIEKVGNSGISDLYVLSDFSVRKEENIEKGYMLGRFGAVPSIKTYLNLWQEE